MKIYSHTHKVVHALEYYSAIKRNKILRHITIWINLENVPATKDQPQKKVASHKRPCIMQVCFSKLLRI